MRTVAAAPVYRWSSLEVGRPSEDERSISGQLFGASWSGTTAPLSTLNAQTLIRLGSSSPADGELVLVRDTLVVDGAEVRVQLVGRGVAGGDALQEHVRRVERHVGVRAGVNVPRRLVVGDERAARLGGRGARAGQDRALGRRVAGRLDVARVVDAVAGDQGALPARGGELLTQQTRVLVVAAVEQRGRAAAGDLVDGAGEVGLLAVRADLVGGDDQRTERRT